MKLKRCITKCVFINTVVNPVSDVNDHTPVFATDPYIVSQNEDIAMGTTVQTVVATDQDIGQAGRDSGARSLFVSDRF